MRIIQILLVLFLLCSSSVRASSNLFVHLDEITLTSKKLSLKVSREASTDRVESIEVITQNNSFTIASALFKQAYAVNLQGIKLTQTVDLNLGLMEDYQLYIPYDLHSEDETEATGEQKLKTRELVIYFNHFKVNKVLTR